MKVFKVTILLAILLIIAMVYLFFSIDTRVAELLKRDPKARFPSIYSDLLTLEAGSNYKAQTLYEELIRRGYVETNRPPSNPGEYWRPNSKTFEVYIREFRDPASKIHEALMVRVETEPIRIFKSNSEPLKELFLEPELIERIDTGETRATKRLSLSEFPQSIQSAILAIEDERFYSHFGIDIEGILRAFIANVRAFGWVQGGSTITQQLAKNLFLSPERTLTRKVLEVFAAISLERRLSKDEILELYLNEVYLGQEGAVAIHGVAESARVYFGKDIEFITIAEAALLAGMIKGPSIYSPRRNLKRALQRKNLVLQKMLDLNVINAKQYEQARSQVIKIAPGQHYQRRAPYLLTTLRNEVDSYLDLDAAVSQGVSIYTGLHIGMQQCAQKAIATGLKELEHSIPSLKNNKQPLQAALVSIEPFSGKIRAWVGGRDFGKNQFDRVSLGKRQIGSTIKPFLYLTAFDSTLNPDRILTPITLVRDEPVHIRTPGGVWTPENYDHKYRGDVTLRYALEKSLNVPAVIVGQWIGIDNLVRTARLFRLADELPAVPALALGAADTSLVRLSAAYGALANGGIYVTPRIFTSILDGEGKSLANSLYEESRVASEAASFVIVNMLQGVIERGTARSVRAHGFTSPAAGKTGTSNDARDAWFAGFTPDLVTGVWVGFDDNRKMGLTGGRAAAPIWTDYMKCASAYHQELSFVAPEGVIFQDLDYTSSQRATVNCPANQIVREIFVSGTEPIEPCRYHYRGQSNQQPSFPEPRTQETPRKRRSLWERIFG